MRVTVGRKTLLSSLRAVLPALDQCSDIPVLNTVILRASANQLAISATNLDIMATALIPATTQSKGSICVAARRLTRIMAAADSDDVEISIAEDGVDFHLGDFTTRMAGVSADEFPEAVEGEWASKFLIDSGDLCRLLKMTSSAISREETRYFLNGVYLHAATVETPDGEARKLRAVATDGHQLARVDMGLPIGAESFAGHIVQTKTVSMLEKHLARVDGDVAVSAAHQPLMRFAFPFAGGDGRLEITSKMINGAFPDYDRATPQAHDFEITLPGSEARRAIRMLCAGFDCRGGAIRIAASADSVTLSTEGGSEFSSTISIAAGAIPDWARIGYGGVSSRLLASNVRHLCGDIVLRGTLATGVLGWDAPLMLSGDDPDHLRVLMPMRVSGPHRHADQERAA